MDVEYQLQIALTGVMFCRPTCGTDAFPSDSLAEVKVVKAPLELEEVGPDTSCEETKFVSNILSEPEAVVSPEGTAGCTEPGTVEVSATEVVIRLLANLKQ